MNGVLVVCGVLVAVAAAIRSTWSPCGWSMLSTITPLGERGRANNNFSSALWYLIGAVAGGASLGGVIAIVAAVVKAAGIPVPAVYGAIALCACVTATCDARLFGFNLPIHRRQVNEMWLDAYRPWVYAGGFGWQVGTGLVTYIMTGGVYLMIVMGALGGSPASAMLLGVLFGLVRGLAVFASARCDTAERLRELHRRFAATGEAVRSAVVVVQLTVAVLVLFALSPVAGLAGIAAAMLLAAAYGVSTRRNGRATQPQLSTTDR